MRHNRYNHKPKEKITLKNNRLRKGYKDSFFNQTWFKVTSVATTFFASAAIIYGSISPQPAQAFSFSSVSDSIGEFFAFKGIAKQTDRLSAAWRLSIEQTARSAPDIGKRIIDSEYKNAATITGEKQGRKILEVYQDLQPGTGITKQMTCTPQSERTAQVSKDIIKRAGAQNDMNSSASTYTQTSISKRGERAYEHINYFCDISEAAQGLCLPRPNGLGGADSNYSTISGNSVLTDEVEQAAYAYINNVIDPVSSEVDTCDSHACDSIKATNGAYKALASMSQNAFVNQINDSKVLYSGSNETSGDSSVSEKPGEKDLSNPEGSEANNKDGSDNSKSGSTDTVQNKTDESKSSKVDNNANKSPSGDNKTST